MAIRLRIQSPDASAPVMAPGNGGQDIVDNDADRESRRGETGFREIAPAVTLEGASPGRPTRGSASGPDLLVGHPSPCPPAQENAAHVVGDPCGTSCTCGMWTWWNIVQDTALAAWFESEQGVLVCTDGHRQDPDRRGGPLRGPPYGEVGLLHDAPESFITGAGNSRRRLRGRTSSQTTYEPCQIWGSWVVWVSTVPRKATYQQV